MSHKAFEGWCKEVWEYIWGDHGSLIVGICSCGNAQIKWSTMSHRNTLEMGCT